MDLDEVTRLFKIRKTILQMLNDRGYIIPPNQMKESLESFRDKYKDRKSLITQVIHTDGKNKMMVYYEEEEKIKMKNLETFINLMTEQAIFSGILVYKKEITSSAKKMVEDQLVTINLELFQEKELLVNITEHELVPRHFPIDDKEKKALLEKYRVKESQLPKILQSDPVARYYGLKKGQVVKIVRDSETAGKYVTYRLVV